MLNTPSALASVERNYGGKRIYTTIPSSCVLTLRSKSGARTATRPRLLVAMKSPSSLRGRDGCRKVCWLGVEMCGDYEKLLSGGTEDLADHPTRLGRGRAGKQVPNRFNPEHKHV